MISMILSGAGGWLGAPLFLVSASLGSMAQKAFAGIVLSGFGSVKGAVVGYLLIGLIESYGVLITNSYRDPRIRCVDCLPRYSSNWYLRREDCRESVGVL